MTSSCKANSSPQSSLLSLTKRLTKHSISSTDKSIPWASTCFPITRTKSIEVSMFFFLPFANVSNEGGRDWRWFYYFVLYFLNNFFVRVDNSAQRDTVGCSQR